MAKFVGVSLTPETCALRRMNARLHRLQAAIESGDAEDKVAKLRKELTAIIAVWQKEAGL